MRIAAIFIHQNALPHIFGKDHHELTLNMGGQFLYEVVETTQGYEISIKKENPEFIEGFWSKEITNVSAIVGGNGSGKSTILHILKEGGFPLVFEEEGRSAISWAKDAGLFIYYTPYLSDASEETEQSYTQNLSKLSYFNRDIPNEPLDFSSFWELHNSEQLKRVITFVKSDVFSEELRNLNIPSFHKIKVQVQKISKDDWQTSRNFRPFFNTFKEIKRTQRNREEIELADKLGIKTKEDLDKNPEYNQSIDKLRLKLEILDGVICKVHSIFENSGNKYLEEGFIENEIYTSDPEFASIITLKEAFYWFLEKAFIKKNSLEFHLPIKQIKELTELLLEVAEKDDDIENWTEVTVDFEDCFEVIESYKDFLLSFKEKFSYDKKAMLIFEPDIRLSTGEMAMYELFSVLLDLQYRLENKINERVWLADEPLNFQNYYILLDEADLGFHPMWKRMFVKSLVGMIPKIFPDKNLQIILTTHSPLSLSDIPSNNMVLLSKDLTSGNTIVASNDVSRINSFGANINDLLANSFFLEDYLIGDFAKDKIDEVIEWIKANKDKDEFNREEYEKMQKIISLIEEPVLRNKLIEMLSEVEINEKFITEMIAKETAYLHNILNRGHD
ncbi:hypothetical protein [Zobellia roscoffensis]|uniref:hypothetical protein n=1 Tax=Zobellia roscoffensis TaxID=2779508 RepID=UPI00188CF16E|nr:hypothetical protein [Zobellia roscoffensis]